jgi:ParB family chromosome partitioning protein
MKYDRKEIIYLTTDEVHPSPFNARKHFDEAGLRELAISIQAKGILQPILVRPRPDDGYEIIAGHRRYRAAGMTPEFTMLPCIVSDVSDDEAIEIMITENLQRKDISPMEEAEGFMQLADMKNMDVHDIAARIGKSPSYVAQRLKLNSLISEIQDIVHMGKLRIKDAMIIAGLSADNQKELFDGGLYRALNSEDNEFIEIDQWHFRQFHGELDEAPFDILDPTIIESAGACDTCQFNTANHMLLMPDAKHICQNLKCFKEKSNLYYDREVQRAVDDPTTACITGMWSMHGEKELQGIAKKVGALEYQQYNQRETPAPPDREVYFEGLDDSSDFDSEADYQEELKDAEDRYAEALIDYEKEKVEFANDLSSGKLIKAFVLGGSDKGKYTYIELKKGVKKSLVAASTNGQNGSTEAADIKSEIERIRDREKRAKELDDAKIWESIFPMIDPMKLVHDKYEVALSDAEMKAIAAAIFKKLDYIHRADFKKYFRAKEVMGVLEYQGGFPYHISITSMLRFFYLSELSPAQVSGKIKGEPALVKAVLEEWYPEKIQVIESNQAEYAKKRAEKVAKRISNLQEKLKTLKAPAPKAKSKSSKKAVEA